jgi:hypothetical protein
MPQDFFEKEWIALRLPATISAPAAVLGLQQVMDQLGAVALRKGASWIRWSRMVFADNLTG